MDKILTFALDENAVFSQIFILIAMAVVFIRIR